jgi:hypothetical protein
MTLDLTPQVVDIIIEGDDQRAITFEFTDVDGNPIDLSGYQVAIDGPTFLRMVPRDPTQGVYDMAILPEDREAIAYRILATQAALSQVLCTGKTTVV